MMEGVTELVDVELEGVVIARADADLIEEGFSGSEIGKALDEYGTGLAENEYVRLLTPTEAITDEKSPFEEEGLLD